eukprot:TRINITY_DN8095_c0_g1_i2.p1 TRINITY_DN8095_c0_g1~~TRINITY_DN8095_c0_g1_i2.p1  ORF type:complete len:184 (-),score=42.71 TRINITY_DN8095_c0_g1_i2:103-624(-)
MSDNQQNSVKRYNKVACGGTFDRLHRGHEVLLEKAASIAERELIIGVTGDVLLKNKKYAEIIQPFPKRKENILQFLKGYKDSVNYRVVELSEPMGPTASEGDVEALVVSEETFKSGQDINKYRQDHGLKPMDLIQIDTIPNRSDLNPEDWKLSSTSLRKKEWEEMNAAKHSNL